MVDVSDLNKRLEEHYSEEFTLSVEQVVAGFGLVTSLEHLTKFHGGQGLTSVNLRCQRALLKRGGEAKNVKKRKSKGKFYSENEALNPKRP